MFERWSSQRLLLPLPPSSLGHLACFSSECPLRCPLIGQGFSFGPRLLQSQDKILLFLSLALSPRVQHLWAAVLCPSLRRQPSPQLRLRICPALARLHAISSRQTEQFSPATGRVVYRDVMTASCRHDMKGRDGPLCHDTIGSA